MSSFSPTLTELSSKVRDSQFLSIVEYANQTLKEIAISNEMVTGQLGFSYKLRDYNYTETVVYRAFVSEKKFHEGVVTTTYTCNAFQECIGVIDLGGVPTIIYTLNLMFNIVSVNIITWFVNRLL